MIISSIHANAQCPTITCPADVTSNNDTSMCDAVVTYTSPIGVDTCGSTNSQTFNYTGAQETFIVPAATNILHTQGLRIGNGEITLSWSGGGASGTMTQIAGLSSGATFPLGITTNTFTYESGGITDTCSFTVTVMDVEVPTISCPSNVEICEGDLIAGSSPATADNCSGELVTYNLTGATTGSGLTNIDGVIFTPGTTTVSYIVTDAGGNQDSCSFDVVVNPSPTVTIASFPSDTICDYNSPITLPSGAPVSGTYSGTGISGNDFDPSIGGIGSHWITYTYTDSLGCTNSDSTQITVDGCAGIDNNNVLSEISIYPNPTNDYITVDFGIHNNSFNYTIVSLDGREIKRVLDITESIITIDLRHESNGVYLLQINNVSNVKIFKIVKK